jgi:hypothetical protein
VGCIADGAQRFVSSSFSDHYRSAFFFLALIGRKNKSR